MATSATDLRTLAAAADGLAAAAQHLVPSAKLTRGVVSGTGATMTWSSQDGKRSAAFAQELQHFSDLQLDQEDSAAFG
jgi:hypothetical protein